MAHPVYSFLPVFPPNGNKTNTEWIQTHGILTTWVVYTKLVCTCRLADTYVTYVCDWLYCYCQKQSADNTPTLFPSGVYV